jgi:hypothetical protein
VTTPPDAAGQSPAEVPVCSAKGCRADARWALLWNNPRLHTPGRRKTWTACDAHREHLSDFLGARGFLRSVEPMGAGGPPGSDPAGTGAPG